MKKKLLPTAETEKKLIAQVLRVCGSGHEAQRKKKNFNAEARRQSLLIASSPEEEEATNWIEDVADSEGW
jgi:hypothetical protein